MALQDYVKQNEAEFSDQIKLTCTVLPTYYTELDVTAATPEVVAANADCLVMEYQVRRQQALSEAGRASTSERNRARYGDPALPNKAVDMAYPTAPATVPSPVMPGIEGRYRKFADFLKSRSGYTEAIGVALGIVEANQVQPDLSLVKPVLPLSLSGVQVYIGWKWQGYGTWLSALRIEVDRGQGWGLLTIDTIPGYTDTTPLPTPGQKWKYRGIFVLDDAPIGQWSDVAEIMVAA